MNSISKNTEQVIIGGLLGDSGISRNKNNHYLYISHGPKQLDYIKHKYKFFEKDMLTTPKGIYDPKTKNYLSYRFYTKTLPLFNIYRNLFYVGNKKIVTQDVLNKLNPLGLAIWFMDDGSRNLTKITNKNTGHRYINGRTLSIATCCFTYEEHEIIQQYFKVVWDLDTRINKMKKYHKIVFNATNANKFIDIIKSNIIPSMLYKIDLEYNTALPIKEDDVLCSL